MRRIYILAIVFFLLITVIVTYVRNKRIASVEQTPQSQAIDTATVNPAQGYLNLVSVGDIIRFPKNQNITLQIKADSDGKIIYGYDVLVDYDTTAFDLVGATSLLPDFTLYKFPKDNYLALTVIQSATSKNAYIFKDRLVAELVFKPKKTGSFIFSINSMYGKEKTKLVDNKAQKIYPKLNSLTVEIY